MYSTNIQPKRSSEHAGGNKPFELRLNDNIQPSQETVRTNSTQTNSFLHAGFTTPPPSPTLDTEPRTPLSASGLKDLVSEDEARFAAFLEKYSSLAKTTIEQGSSVTSECEDPTLSCTSLRSAISFAEWRKKSALSGVSEDLKACTELTEHPDVDIVLLSRDGKPTTHPVLMCSHTANTDMLIVPQMLLAKMGGVTDCHDVSSACNATKVEHESGKEIHMQTGTEESNAEELSAINRQVLTLQIALKFLKEQVSTLTTSHTKEIETLEEERLREREAAAETIRELEKRNKYLRTCLDGREKRECGNVHPSTVAKKDMDWSDSHWRISGIWECDGEGDSQLPMWEHDRTEFVPWPLETIVIHSHQNINS